MPKDPKTTFIGINYLSEFITKGLDKSKFFDFIAKKLKK